MVKRSDELREYLDGAILRWRMVRDVYGIPADTKQKAEYYVDAFQSVRLAAFGSTLP